MWMWMAVYWTVDGGVTMWMDGSEEGRKGATREDRQAYMEGG